MQTETTPTETAELSADVVDRMTQVRAEERVLKEWKRGGKVGDRPDTPLLDEMTAAYDAAGGAPGSSLAFLLGKHERRRSSATSTPRQPAMPEAELVRRLREMFDADPKLTQTGATSALTADGATIRQVRAAYKVVSVDRPKVTKPAPVKKTTAKTKTAPKTKAPTATEKLASKALSSAVKSTAKVKKTPAKPAAKTSTTKAPASKKTATKPAPVKKTTKQVTPRFKASKASA